MFFLIPLPASHVFQCKNTCSVNGRFDLSNLIFIFVLLIVEDTLPLLCTLKKCPWSNGGNRNEFAFMFQDSLIQKLAFGCFFFVLFFCEVVLCLFFMDKRGKIPPFYSHAEPLIIMYNTDAKNGGRTCSELNEIAPLASISQRPHTLLLKRCDSCMQTWVGTL